jgi:hypothetical protein
MTTNADAIPEQDTLVPDATDVAGNWVLLTQNMTGAQNYVAVMDWVTRQAMREDDDVRMLFVAALHASAFEDADGSAVLLNPQRLAHVLLLCREQVRGESASSEWTAGDEQRKRRQQAGHDLVEYVRTAFRLFSGPDDAPPVLDRRSYLTRLMELERQAGERPDVDRYQAGMIFNGVDCAGHAIHPSLFRGCWDMLPVLYHKRAMRLQNLPADYVPWVMERLSSAALDVAA